MNGIRGWRTMALAEYSLSQWHQFLGRPRGHEQCHGDFAKCSPTRGNDYSYVGQLVSCLAAKHSLVFYDPQSEKVVYSGALPESKPWWKIW